MQYELAERQLQNIQDTVIITGCPRSGTSVFGQIISTFEGMEYHYEPQIVHILMRLLDRNEISKNVAFLLLRMYLHEDLLVESAHARKVNLRPNDTTLILNSMPWKELIHRWSSIANTADALAYINERNLRVAIKTINVIGFISNLREALPEAKFLLILRDGRDVVYSLLQRNWLTDEALQHHYWPYKFVDGHRIPDRVDDDMAARWVAMKPIDRACYLWRRDAESSIEAMSGNHRDHLHAVRYEALLSEPEPLLTDVARFLSSRMTDQTYPMVRSLRPYKPRASYAFLDDADPKEFKRFREVNEALGYRW
jgi:hypothetical protein